MVDEESEMWSDTDFSFNRSFWKKWGHEAALVFRVQNLVVLQEVMRGHAIDSFVYGRSLRDLVISGWLEEDHDDDVIVSPEAFRSLPEKVVPHLLAEGFSLVRAHSEIYSLVRDGRYIDIHPYSGNPGAETMMRAHGAMFSVPEHARQLLIEKYGSDMTGNARRKGAHEILLSVRSGVRGLFGSQHHGSRPFRARVRQGLRFLANSLVKKQPFVQAKKTPRALTRAEFLDLQLEETDSQNWSWRGRHLRLVSQPGETLRETIERLPTEIDGINRAVIETPLDNVTEEPVSLSRMFWKNGNNYFWFPFLYGFRHRVMPYHAANLYIRARRGPALYSKEYYLSLPKMTDEEIESLLVRSPIEVRRGAIVSGRHRAMAMAGRIFAGDSYLPVRCVEVD